MRDAVADRVFQRIEIEIDDRRTAAAGEMRGRRGDPAVHLGEAHPGGLEELAHVPFVERGEIGLGWYAINTVLPIVFTLEAIRIRRSASE